MPQRDLLAECKKVFKELSISKEEAAYLAEATKLQSESLVWFEHRRGRLTASRFLSFCKTVVESPSKSLIDAVFQRKTPPKAAALCWGIEKEEIARKQYEEIMKEKHASFKLSTTGLHVNPQYPHLGASPDGLVTCSCCGDGLLEIKCPYSLRHTTPQSPGKDFYLKPSPDGVRLSTTHQYYYQVQGQLVICNRSYSDFVCWTPRGIHVERIARRDEVFLEMKPKLDKFFVHVILPRILSGQMDQENEPPTSACPGYCYCRKGEQGDMVACDNPSCPYEWFHFKCVGLKSPPEGAWFCPDCELSRQ